MHHELKNTHTQTDSLYSYLLITNHSEGSRVITSSPRSQEIPSDCSLLRLYTQHSYLCDNCILTPQKNV